MAEYRDLGLMGESIFSTLCGSGGVALNKSVVDKTGWDFLVEFPFEENCNVSLDMAEAPIECKVQVKATDRCDKKVQIKLSNLHRLVQSSIPSFIVLVEFDGVNCCQGIYVYHVWKSLIKRVLKRLREISVQKKKPNINKRKMTIDFNDANLLKENDGADFKKIIKEYIGSNYDDYIHEKKEYKRNVGFGEDKLLINGVIVGDKNIKKLADAYLGIDVDVEINKIKISEKRFDLIVEDENVKSSKGVMKVEKVRPNSFGKIYFSNTIKSIMFEFNCKFYAGLLGVVRDDLARTRIECDYFNIFISISDGDVKFNYNFDRSEKDHLKKVLNFFNFVRFVSTPGNKVVFEIENYNVRKEVGILNVNTSMNDFDDICKASEKLNKIIVFFGADDGFRISIAEVVFKMDDICLCWSALDGSAKQYMVTFESAEGDLFSGDELVCVKPVYWQFGNRYFVCIISLTGKPLVSEESGYKVMADKIKIEKKIVFSRYSVSSNDDVALEMKNVGYKYEDREVIYLDMPEQGQ